MYGGLIMMNAMKENKAEKLIKENPAGGQSGWEIFTLHPVARENITDIVREEHKQEAFALQLSLKKNPNISNITDCKSLVLEASVAY